MEKTILPTPVLAPRPNFWQRLVSNLKLFGMISAGGFVIFMLMSVFLSTTPLLISLQLSAIMAGAIFLMGFLIGITNPSMETAEEAAYRKRLEAAAHYFVHEGQLKADLEELLKTMNDLPKDEIMAIRDREIIQRTIKRAFAN